MKNPPTLLSGQFSPVPAAKGIMKNFIPGKSYKLFCNTHFRTIANSDKCNFCGFFEGF